MKTRIMIDKNNPHFDAVHKARLAFDAVRVQAEEEAAALGKKYTAINREVKTALWDAVAAATGDPAHKASDTTQNFTLDAEYAALGFYFVRSDEDGCCHHSDEE